MTVDISHSTARAALPDPPEHAALRRADIAWAAGIRDGNEEDFSAAFRAHVASLVGYARRFVRSDAVAQDIVMDVFFRLWRDRRTLRPELRLGAYLQVAVRNAALNKLAHGRVEARWRERGLAEGWSPALSAPRLAPDEELERAEAKESLRSAYTTLPIRLRQVIELRWFHGLSYQEIARELRVSVKSVDNYLAKGMHLLREAMKNGAGR
jgi:RNA polymerase sigma-70 factor (ECF subfamily)